uniref:Uncharacterized protein n=1 Tax=Arundo donax TaxID=35708 RepID=A0A0A9FF04_ARUDO
MSRAKVALLLWCCENSKFIFEISQKFTAKVAN